MRFAEADLDVMRHALQVAKASAAPDPEGDDLADVPVGAVVIDVAGNVMAEAANRRRGSTDPTAHAEVVALRAAGERLGTWRLDGCSLVVTLEPCPMCAGAAVNARLARIVFGAWNPAYGACGSLFDIPRDQRLRHRPQVVAGALADECGALVSDFFRDRR